MTQDNLDVEPLLREREHLERALSERFNFLLVFVSIVAGGAFASSGRYRSAAMLFFGSVVGVLLAAVLARTTFKLRRILDKLDNRPGQAVSATRSRKLHHPWYAKLPVLCTLGYVLPILFFLAMSIAGVAVLQGWLDDPIVALRTENG